MFVERRLTSFKLILVYKIIVNQITVLITIHYDYWNVTLYEQEISPWIVFTSDSGAELLKNSVLIEMWYYNSLLCTWKLYDK